MYERQMQLLRSQLMSPSTPSLPYSFEAFSKMTPTGTAPSSFHPRYQQWARDRFVATVFSSAVNMSTRTQLDWQSFHYLELTADTPVLCLH